MLRKIACGALVVSAVVVMGCGRGGSATGGGSSKETGMAKEAKEFVLAEINKHGQKTVEGWVTAIAVGSGISPVEYLRQYKEVAVSGVETYDLSDTDKMNGFEWAGAVSFKETPVREAGDVGFVAGGLDLNASRPKGRWSQWVSYTPEEIKVQKVHGKWEMPQSGMVNLANSRMPTGQDWAKAGVKP